ncbi:3-hydroxyacyl-CoA dehydrogenase NAD-binding domain-containing protein [Glycomyces halotolerans]
MSTFPVELPEFPDEVVTEALVRYVEPPGLDGRAAIITLDNGFDHTKPTSMGPAGMQNLWNALDEVLASDAKLIAVTGKPFIFLAGADIKMMPLLETREQGLAMAQAGHALYKRLKDSQVPTFAFVNGTALGGGMELALHCHYRTVSASAVALGLPEVSIGLIPGWGGSQILPNLIGPEAAAQVIIANPLNQNKMLRGPDLTKLGIADAQFEAADFLEESLAWAVRVVRGEETVRRPEVDRGDSWKAVIAGARQTVDEKIHNASPAAMKALDLLELARTASFEEGSLAEDEALADLEMAPEFKTSLYSFNLVRQLGKRPAGAPSSGLAKEIGKVGVVGAGLMAGQIALMFARRLEVPVVMTDLDAERTERGLAYVRGEIDKLESKGRLSKLKAAKMRALVSADTDKGVYADCDLVIEAVFEELGVKQQVFGEVEQIVSEECLLVTNTSGLSVTAMASKLSHPERVVGMHFFNPVAVMPLVEVIAAESTDDATLATAFAVAKKLKKTAIRSADRPAFIVNRLLGRMLAEVTGAVDEGTPPEAADTALDELGLPMRPFALLELVGLQVAWHLTSHLHEDLGPRFPLSQNLKRLAECREPVFDPEAKGKGRLTDAGRALLEFGDRASTAEEVRHRVLAGLAEEVKLMLDEGVVPGPEQIDLAMILGAGFPFWLGGLTPYLDRTGVSSEVAGKPFGALDK